MRLPSFLLLSLLIVGCDPAFRYRPASGSRSDAWTWSTQINGVRIRVGEFGGIHGSEYFATQLDLTNNTDQAAVIEDAHLITADGEYEVDFPGNGEIRWRRAGPGSEASIHLVWWFDHPATDVLGDRPAIILDLRIGEQEHQLEIEYERIK